MMRRREFISLLGGAVAWPRGPSAAAIETTDHRVLGAEHSRDRKPAAGRVFAEVA